MSLDEGMARFALKTRTGNVENITPIRPEDRRDFVPTDGDCPRCGVSLDWASDCPGPHWDLDESSEERTRKDRARCDERAVRKMMNLGFSEASARHRLELARLAVVHVPWVAVGLLAIAEAKAELA